MAIGFRLLLLTLLLPVLVACGLPTELGHLTGVEAQAEEVVTATPLPASATPEPATPTATPTVPTATSTPTVTPTASATATPTPTRTAIPQPSNTPTPDGILPPTRVPPPTSTARPTRTPTVQPTPTPLPPTPTYPPPPAVLNVPILMYHYISEVPPDADIYRLDLTVPPERFEAQLRYLKEQGYETVTLADLYETLSTGRPLPPRPIVLTFDDGYKDAYTHALPLLQAYGYVGEFFVLATPAHYEDPHYLSWEEMKLMADAGMSIQAHGRDHVDLTGRDYDFLVYQILGVREAVEAHVGRPVRFFCYPSGRYDADTEAVVTSAGYWGGVTTEWGTELRLDNRYTWPRLRIRGEWDMEQFASLITALEESE